MGANTKVRNNAGYLLAKNGNVMANQAMPVDPLALANEALRKSAQSGGSYVPPIETYDLNYEILDPGVDTAAQPSLSKKRKYFLPRNAFFIIGRTNQEFPILSEDALNMQILATMKNTLGYRGVGKVPTYEKQGIVSKVFMLPDNNKLNGVSAEAYMQSAPVLTERGAQCLVVIQNINTGFS